MRGSGVQVSDGSPIISQNDGTELKKNGFENIRCLLYYFYLYIEQIKYIRQW